MQTSPFRLPRNTRLGIAEDLAERLLGLRTLEQMYQREAVKDLNSDKFLDSVLQMFQVDYRINSGSESSIPASGGLVVVANHPFGGIEGVALAALLMKVRPDVKVLTNEILCRIPELQDIFIGVDILGKDSRQKNQQAIKEARKWVQDGHLLLLFPSGEVSSYDFVLKQVVDPKWRNTAAIIARDTSARVIPVFVEGNNGWLFQCLGMIHPRFRTLRLIRELLNKKGATLGFRIGNPIEPEALSGFSSNSAVTNFLRLHTYLLSAKSAVEDIDPAYNKQTAFNEDIISAVNPDILMTEIEELPDECLLIDKGDVLVYCTRAQEIPETLREIGRLRELTFRQVGEGSGQALDIDKYDEYYLHLFLWNRKKSEVMGAYRIGQVDEVIRNHGVHGMYTRSLFRYQGNFLHRLGSCLEMGRSFVRPEYQKSLNALLMLWKGIGAYVAQNPKYRVLFGPVSISSDYNEVSRQLMAGCLGVNNSDQALAELVSPTTPLKQKKQFWSSRDLEGLKNIEQLSSLVQQIEKDNKGIPILLKQYLKLSGELAAFNVDPDFNNALDGLIVVDLTRVEERTLYKYMGAQQAQYFLNYHRSVA